MAISPASGGLHASPEFSPALNAEKVKHYAPITGCPKCNGPIVEDARKVCQCFKCSQIVVEHQGQWVAWGGRAVVASDKTAAAEPGRNKKGRRRK